MKLIFIDDGPIYYDSRGNYYEYAFHGLYDRYRYIADEIIFMIRTAPVTAQTGGTLLHREIKVISIPNFKTPKQYFHNKKTADKIMKREIQKADVLILRGSACAQMALRYAKAYKKPYIYEVVGCDWDKYWNYSLLGKAIAPFMFIRSKYAIYSSKYVYYVTKKFLQKRYPTLGQTVECSNVVIDKSDISVLEKRYKKIEHLKNSDKPIIIGTAAALDVRYKGQQDVMKAMKRMIELGYNVQYRLAGDNRKNSFYLKKIAEENKLSDRVVFCGSLSKEDMKVFYDELDVYIHPSMLEGLSRAMIEAMSRGCPVIAADVGGASELLDSQFLFKKKNVKGIINSFINLMDSNMFEIAENNFRKANDEYSFDTLKSRREKFYDAFIRNNELHK